MQDSRFIVPIKPDIGYLPTPQEAVEVMLSLAEVCEADILYDLGSGDGRVLITAAQKFGTRGVGIDIDPQRISQAIENAQQSGVSDRVMFLHQNLFESDFYEATIVVLYLLPHLNLRLRPRLLQQLKPGTRILSHDFDMGDWQPHRVQTVKTPEETATVYQWIVPSEVPAHLR
jgi:ribosomal protein L11 methylase PrmA